MKILKNDRTTEHYLYNNERAAFVLLETIHFVVFFL